MKRREPSARPPLPEPENEPSPGEAAVWHKRRLRECRRGLALAAPVVVLMWLPWVLEYMERPSLRWERGPFCSQGGEKMNFL